MGKELRTRVPVEGLALPALFLTLREYRFNPLFERRVILSLLHIRPSFKRRIFVTLLRLPTSESPYEIWIVAFKLKGRLIM